jgi:hypothetical protein
LANGAGAFLSSRLFRHLAFLLYGFNTEQLHASANSFFTDIQLDCNPSVAITWLIRQN